MFPRTLKDITMIYNDISGLHISFSEWRDFCRDAWKERYNYIQIDKDKYLDDMFSMRNLSGLQIAAVPEIAACKKLKFILNNLGIVKFIDPVTIYDSF